MVLSIETLEEMCLLDQGRPMTHKTTILTLKHVYHRYTFMEYITDYQIIHYDKTRDRNDLRKGVYWFTDQGTQFTMVE